MKDDGGRRCQRKYFHLVFHEASDRIIKKKFLMGTVQSRMKDEGKERTISIDICKGQGNFNG